MLAMKNIFHFKCVLYCINVIYHDDTCDHFMKLLFVLCVNVKKETFMKFLIVIGLFLFHR